MISPEVGTMWVPCGYPQCHRVSGCQISSATVPMLRSLELPRIEGLKVGMPKDLRAPSKACHNLSYLAPYLVLV